MKPFPLGFGQRVNLPVVDIVTICRHVERHRPAAMASAIGRRAGASGAMKRASGTLQLKFCPTLGLSNKGAGSVVKSVIFAQGGIKFELNDGPDPGHF
ncbi:hypothetical protein EVAR_20959_1 [Eumeta japonica]|uniref:Uncharacterized protein n=1 Tax=Eumeta variegata TaxID=151549 RepID=A0A4C1V4W1_EUMVA|nr:hypothetical protein EVAR_20959_1 [Eumeta japonica]